MVGKAYLYTITCFVSEHPKIESILFFPGGGVHIFSVFDFAPSFLLASDRVLKDGISKLLLAMQKLDTFNCDIAKKSGSGLP